MCRCRRGPWRCYATTGPPTAIPSGSFLPRAVAASGWRRRPCRCHAHSVQDAFRAAVRASGIHETRFGPHAATPLCHASPGGRCKPASHSALSGPRLADHDRPLHARDGSRRRQGTRGADSTDGRPLSIAGGPSWSSERKSSGVMARNTGRKFKARLLPSHLAAMEAIEQCRTEALGGHLYQCTDCEALEYSDHSCKNRHCPTCQNDSCHPVAGTAAGPPAPCPLLSRHFHAARRTAASRPLTPGHPVQPPLSDLRGRLAGPRSRSPPPRWADRHGRGPAHLDPRPRVPSPCPFPRARGRAVPRGHAVALSPLGGLARPVRALSRLFRGTFKAALTTAGLDASRPTPGLAQGVGDPLPTRGDRYRGPRLLRPLHLPYCPHQQPPGNADNGQVTFRFQEARRSRVETPARCPPKRSSTASFSMCCHGDSPKSAPTAS